MDYQVRVDAQKIWAWIGPDRSVRRAAEDMGIYQRALENILYRRSKLPSVLVLYNIAKAMDTTMEDLLEED